MGAGGVAPSVIYALSKKGIKQIFISNRTAKKTEDIKKKFPYVEIVNWKNIEEAAENMDIIINATSLGLKSLNNFEQKFERIKLNLVYYDIIYNPDETIMIKNFKKNGAKTFNGLEMFMYQGQKSFFIWNKIKPDIDDEVKQTIALKLK